MNKYLQTGPLAAVTLALFLWTAVTQPFSAVGAETDRAIKAAEAAADQAIEKAEAALDRVEAQLEKIESETPEEDLADWGDRPEETGKGIQATGHSVTVKAGQVVPEVVVTKGSATIDGEVTGDVVVIMGKARINGRVWGSVVNVGHGIVLGPEAKILGDAVGIIGGIHMKTNSLIVGQAIGILGGITKQAGAKIMGDEVPVGSFSGPEGLDLPEPFKRALDKNFKELVLLGRPLSLSLGWVWVVFAVFTGIYLLFGLVFPSACELTAEVLRNRALTSAVVGLLMVPLVPLVLLLMAITGVLIVAVPFVAAAVFLGGLFGKAALLLFVGQAVGRGFKSQFPTLVAILVGAGVLALLYLVPFFGLLVLKFTDVWALGAAMVALFIGFRRERPPAPAAAVAGAVPVAGTPAFVGTVANSADSSYTAPPAEFAPQSQSASSDPHSSIPPGPEAEVTAAPIPSTPEALTLPRVGFKDRFWATCIDWLVLTMVCGPTGLMAFFMFLFPLYFAAMWVWKGTTIGGIVLRLKVVRLDGRRLDWPTAGVRAVGALFGSMAGGLGYFWSGWDAEKQGWHDKIAGTVVVKANAVQPLV